MKKIIKAMIALGVVLLASILLISCSETVPYDEYDSEGYNVSIRYDANGGMFTTNVEVIVDTYNLSELPDGEGGKKALSLISPDDAIRGTGNNHTASNAGYFLAGWYLERTPIKNSVGQELDADGNVAADSGKPVAYNYSGRWDFKNDVMQIDPAKQYSASEPITLYAAWIPEFKFEFYSIQTGELLGDYPFDPNYIKEIDLPSWSEESGKLEMYKFPSVSEKTLDGVYLDAEGTTAVQGDRIAHLGSYDAATATASNPVTKLYLDYVDGEWFRIYTAKQFMDNITAGGCYEILADLDFTGIEWKTSLLHGNFRGKINGNGHSFNNIKVSQTDTGRQNTGLFAYVGADTVIKDLSFDDCQLTIEKGTRQQDAAFGFLAGTVESGATFENVSFDDCALLIDGGANILANTSIGLVSGVGEIGSVETDGIDCRVVGDNKNNMTVTVDGNEVTVTY